MKKGRFSEEQIVAVLKEAEAGISVRELRRKHGISDATLTAQGVTLPGSRRQDSS